MVQNGLALLRRDLPWYKAAAAKAMVAHRSRIAAVHTDKVCGVLDQVLSVFQSCQNVCSMLCECVRVKHTLAFQKRESQI